MCDLTASRSGSNHPRPPQRDAHPSLPRCPDLRLVRDLADLRGLDLLHAGRVDMREASAARVRVRSHGPAAPAARALARAKHTNHAAEPLPSRHVPARLRNEPASTDTGLRLTSKHEASSRLLQNLCALPTVPNIRGPGSIGADETTPHERCAHRTHHIPSCKTDATGGTEHNNKLFSHPLARLSADRQPHLQRLSTTLWKQLAALETPIRLQCFLRTYRCTPPPAHPDRRTSPRTLRAGATNPDDQPQPKTTTTNERMRTGPELRRRELCGLPPADSARSGRKNLKAEPNSKTLPTLRT